MSTVLSRLASITAIRDIELFELSVLKTLTEILKVRGISLYKFSDANIPNRLLRYSSETIQSNKQRRQDESHEIQIMDIEVPDYITLAQQWILSTNKPYSLHREGAYLTVYPIIGPNSIVGYVSIEMPKQMTEGENVAITSMLKIFHNFHTLLEENQKDKLTGLLNRKTFDDSIAKIQTLMPSTVSDVFLGIEQRIDVNQRQFWLAVIDIDHFKSINDTFGHVYGDEVLLLVAQLMKHNFRDTDLLFRFGGEEFVIIANSKSKDSIHKALERFRYSIEQFSFPQINQVTVSIGATQISESFVLATEVVGRADSAMYYAKHNGRNRVFFYEDLIAQGKIEKTTELTGSIDLF